MLAAKIGVGRWAGWLVDQKYRDRLCWAKQKNFQRKEKEKEGKKGGKKCGNDMHGGKKRGGGTHKNKERH